MITPERPAKPVSTALPCISPVASMSSTDAPAAAAQRTSPTADALSLQMAKQLNLAEGSTQVMEEQQDMGSPVLEPSNTSFSSSNLPGE